MKQHLTSLILLGLLTLSACESTSTGPQEVSTASPADTTNSTQAAQEGDDDRGFDPCLLNSSLAICNSD